MTTEEARSGRPTVVVAVVSWNTRELLDRCLRSLRDDFDRGLAEVWVVDNMSTDGSAEMVRSSHPWVRLVEPGENLGYGRAVNLVASRAPDADWVVASNADIALRDGALRALVAAGERDTRAGIVAPRLVLPDGSTQQSVWPLPTLFSTALGNLGPRVVPAWLGDRLALRTMWRPERRRRVPWAIGAFVLVRRSAWDAVGGFDPRQWMSAEDLDLAWRVRDAGWVTRYEPAAVVDHEESAATGQVWGDELVIHWQRCTYAWMLGRRGRGPLVAIGLINFLGALPRLLAYLVLARLRAGGPWAERVRPALRWVLVHRYALAPRRVLERYR